MAGFHNAHFLIPEILWRQLRTKAKELGKPTTSVVNEAIQRFLKTATRTTSRRATTAKRAGTNGAKKRTSKNG